MTRPPLAIESVPFDEIHHHRGALESMLRGDRVGMIVRGAFPREQMHEVVSRLGEQRFAITQYDSEHFKGRTFGHPLIVWGDNLAPYFRDGAMFTEAAARLFEGGVDYQARIEEILSALSDGREVAVPRGPDGAPYLASSIRELVGGGEILVHCENETLRFPAMKHLSTLIDPTSQLSYYLTLSTGERGGDLMVYGVRFDDGPGRKLASMERLTPETLEYLGGFGHVVMDAGVGDLLIFDAGRHFHRVSRVEGERVRRTMGGFLALSRDRSRLYYWS